MPILGTEWCFTNLCSHKIASCVRGMYVYVCVMCVVCACVWCVHVCVVCACVCDVCVVCGVCMCVWCVHVCVHACLHVCVFTCVCMCACLPVNPPRMTSGFTGPPYPPRQGKGTLPSNGALGFLKKHIPVIAAFKIYHTRVHRAALAQIPSLASPCSTPPNHTNDKCDQN